jgi:exopolyphosphatase/guanosine-5'-triphosphate,3'-diphosphate pyrophosphatase
MRVAAVDIGTNSTRLLVADSDESGLTSIFRTTSITRLGEGVDSKRRIDAQAMERTCATLTEYSDKIRALESEKVGVIATSACREAQNRDEFFDLAQQSLGVRPKLLTEEWEAGLSFAGAASAWKGDDLGPYLVVDIGGGSTEISVGVYDSAAADAYAGSDQTMQLPGMHLFGWTSLKIGCVRITERFLHSDPPKPEELSEAIREVDAALVSAESLVPVGEAKTMVGLAGTVTSLAAMDLGLHTYDPDAVHHHHLTSVAVEKLFRYLATSTRSELYDEPALEPKRADVIVGGTVVLVAMLRRWKFSELVVSEADILDGAALATSLGLIGSDAS